MTLVENPKRWGDASHPGAPHYKQMSNLIQDRSLDVRQVFWFHRTDATKLKTQQEVPAVLLPVYWADGLLLFWQVNKMD